MNEIPCIGHNKPPPSTPYETACEDIEALYGEAALWLDGATVESQSVADGLAKLIAMLREAVKKADAARLAEKKPFDEGKAEVQARYAPLIADTKTQKGKAILALDVCKNALAPWLDAIDRAQREAAEAARRVATEKARAAQDAIRAADAANLAEREAAEELLKDAKRADVQANRIERATATAATGGRAIGPRTTDQPQLVGIGGGGR